jgi:sulfate transport system ATP-binding protein
VFRSSEQARVDSRFAAAAAEDRGHSVTDAVPEKPMVAAARAASVALEVQGLTKRFTAAGTPAVAEVSFTAPEGCITTLLGPSGSGKSTVLRIVAGLEQADAGVVSFGGHEVTHVPVQQRGVGMVFQSYALFKHMTVRDNVAFGMAIRKRPAAETGRRVDELLALVQLDGLAGRFPAQLSGGQRQRVALARALAIEPRILLLDEPFGALDTKVRVELREWLRDLHERVPMTTLMVTHDQEEALELSQHIVVMHEGRVAQAGSPREIYDKPRTPFVASFVGGANLLMGKAQDGRAEVGNFAVSTPGAPDGASVSAFVRPHDVKLSKPLEQDDGSTPDVAVAKVERLALVGAYVKVSLKLADGTPMTVQMPRTEIDALGIAENDRVLVDLREAKVFVEDFAI